ncbi:hypothetical protein GQ44DRAFT_257746 [Phaeosphaeriaceae sp. PMI808]|nr:hypothetical protein GQ44DRAFT_257746 [Phaeosphaeriaceae sp. PMI808]
MVIILFGMERFSTSVFERIRIVVCISGSTNGSYSITLRGGFFWDYGFHMELFNTTPIPFCSGPEQDQTVQTTCSCSFKISSQHIYYLMPSLRNYTLCSHSRVVHWCYSVARRWYHMVNPVTHVSTTQIFNSRWPLHGKLLECLRAMQFCGLAASLHENHRYRECALVMSSTDAARTV